MAIQSIIHGFDDNDFFRFRANPFKSCDKGKEFHLEESAIPGLIQ